jgi:hypothetical protein
VQGAARRAHSPLPLGDAGRAAGADCDESASPTSLVTDATPQRGLIGRIGPVRPSRTRTACCAAMVVGLIQLPCADRSIRAHRRQRAPQRPAPSACATSQASSARCCPGRRLPNPDVGVPRAFDLDGDHFDPVTAIVGFNDHRPVPVIPLAGLPAKSGPTRGLTQKRQESRFVLQGGPTRAANDRPRRCGTRWPLDDPRRARTKGQRLFHL